MGASPPVGGEDIEPAIAALTREAVHCMYIQAAPPVPAFVREIGALLFKYRIPAISELRDLARSGAVLSYGPNLFESTRRQVYFVDRILRGSKPADLPVEEATNLELVINVKTAKAFGLDMRPRCSLALTSDRIKRRREFITLMGGAAAWPLAARAQQTGMPVIGILGASSAEASEVAVVAFRQGLGEIGYVEGRNVTIEYHWSDGQYDRASPMLLDMVRRRVSVIVTLFGTRNAVFAKEATSAIPIVFYVGTDPVEAGLVASLNRPGGNLTGATDLAVELGPKRIELLRELLPNLTTVATFVNTASPASVALGQEVEVATKHLGMNFQAINVTVQSDFESAFDGLRRNRVGSLLVSGDFLYSSSRDLIVSLAVDYHIPVIYYSREYVDAGGLMSYGPSAKALSRQVGSYVGQILKGTKPSDLRVIQPTVFELVINRKAAQALQLTLPSSLLVFADEIIE